jgi:GalNAc-alpha-(1->4)-GalNAc-alpha-(1->3)-diNAcBac-PP-undecaprenol alpha-1,4-N-acetyl-D-galactosaminyltransferase
MSKERKNKKKKIVIVIYSLGAGGAERVVSQLSGEFSKKFEVWIWTFDDGKSFYPLKEGVKHRTLSLAKKTSGLAERLIWFFKRVWIISRILRKEKPDIVLSFMTQTNYVTILSAKIANIPVVVSERTAYLACPSKLKRVFYPLADLLVVQTNEDARHYGFVKNVAVIPNPFTFQGKSKNNKEKIVLAVGRLVEEKGFDLLIEVFEEIDQNDYKLVIVGDGPLRESLESMVRTNKVIFVGRQKDVESFYQRAQIFVLSSKLEGFPNALLEAMGYGCACIAFDCPYGPGEIIEDGVNGILVEHQNKEALKKSLMDLMENENKRKNLARRAIAVRENFSLQKIEKQWEKLFDEVWR